MKKLFAISLFMLFGVLSLSAQVHEDFTQRKQQLNRNQYYSVFDKKLSKDEREALEFLYAYMPLPDMVDYDGDFYLRNVRASLQARKTMAWGKKTPDYLWRHFVLPIRVNNENMDMSREVFFKELKSRVKGMSMTEAALEVNHWCHEKVTYTPSDSRTSAPLATVRSAFGRCGEQSTFAVAAMRSVGIPARQVYTPRWAHTDDNHAWVEVWVDGEWHFLGACEPEAVLDLGWFNAPASRGMLMHTKVFGRYEGHEEVMSSNNCFTEIDVTENYAPVAKAVVRVVDTDGKPVAGAKIEYKLYNYAEFYTLATKYSDSEGMCSLSAGMGDLLVWVSKDGKFGLEKLSVGKQSVVTIVLNKTDNFLGSYDFDMVPPAERNTIPYQTEEQIEHNKQRFVYEDSLRHAYVATFHTGNKFVEASRGNHATIEKFLATYPGVKAEALLASLSQKDLRDVPYEVLVDHYTNSGSVDVDASSLEQGGTAGDHGSAAGAQDSRVANYLCPRISNEMLTPYRGILSKEATLKAFAGRPEALAQWVRENVAIDGDWNPQSLCMSPVQVFNCRIADKHSRDIFYVAAARSLGDEARIDPVTAKVQYRAEGQWKDVNFDAETKAETRQGTLTAVYDNNAHNENPKYYSHFSLSKLNEGNLQLLEYSEYGCDYESLLKPGTTLDEGNYLLVTGNRMADGSVLSHLQFVPVTDKKTTEVNLVMRENTEGVQVIGSFNSENIYNDDNEGPKSLLSTTGRGYYVLGLITPNQEPTNHALKDIALLKSDLEAWGQKIVLLFKDEDEKARFTNRAEFKNLPETIVWGTDVDGKINKEVEEAMKLTTPNRPVFLICDTFNRVVFISQGYTIGLGEQLMSVIKKLK